MKKKIMSLVLAAAMVMSLTGISVVCASEIGAPSDEWIKDYVYEQVSESFDDYYTIPAMTVTILDKTVDEGTVTAVVKAEFTRILKAESAYDLPYIQGLQEGLSELTDPGEIAAAQRYLDAWVKDLTDNYIGKEQTETAKFKVELPMNNGSMYRMDNRAFIQFVDAVTNETFDMDEFAPQAETELHTAGLDAAKQTASVIAFSSAPVFDKVQGPSDATDYNRIAARNYARTYASKPNSAYEFFREKGDCANFVSQCIHAGGIEPEEGVWEPYTTAWSAVRFTSNNMGINEYMVSRSYFFECEDITRAFAGSILSWKNRGHVALVDQNDTVHMTYCAHTENEKSAPFAGATNIKAYIPVWDSYSGQYTPQ